MPDDILVYFIGPSDEQTCDGCEEAVNGNPYSVDEAPEPGSFECASRCRHLLQLSGDAPDDVAPYVWSGSIGFVEPNADEIDTIIANSPLGPVASDIADLSADDAAAYLDQHNILLDDIEDILAPELIQPIAEALDGLGGAELSLEDALADGDALMIEDRLKLNPAEYAEAITLGETGIEDEIAAYTLADALGEEFKVYYGNDALWYVTDNSDLIANKLTESLKEGGAGSGNFNHSGRPGEVGGSGGFAALLEEHPTIKAALSAAKELVFTGLLYHGTSQKTKKLILKDGFKQSVRGQYGPGIYLSLDYNTAKGFAGVVERPVKSGDPTVVHVHASGLRLAEYSESSMKVLFEAFNDAAKVIGYPRDTNEDRPFIALAQVFKKHGYDGFSVPSTQEGIKFVNIFQASIVNAFKRESATRASLSHNHVIAFNTEKLSLIPMQEGGSGSGNFSHAGRPGVRGGSAPNLAAHLRRVATIHELAQHEPLGAKTAIAYAALKKETLEQYQSLLAKGVKFNFTNKDPYTNSKEMMADAAKGTLNVFTGGDMASSHPLAEFSEKYGHTFNNIFRGVHDYFGHFVPNLSFGAKGELGAFQTHAKMFSKAALPALAAETLAQNAWVNFFGDHQSLKPQDRPFADQKAYAFPEHIAQAFADGKFPRKRVFGESCAHDEEHFCLEEIDGEDYRRPRGRMKIKAREGGEGSGNFSHAGRPGEVGGSATGGDQDTVTWRNDGKVEVAAQVLEFLAENALWMLVPDFGIGVTLSRFVGTLWHGTTKAIGTIIRRDGFHAGKNMSFRSLPLVYGPGIYLTDSKSEAEKYGEDLLKVNIEANLAKMSQSTWDEIGNKLLTAWGDRPLAGGHGMFANDMDMRKLATKSWLMTGWVAKMGYDGVHIVGASDNGMADYYKLSRGQDLIKTIEANRGGNLYILAPRSTGLSEAYGSRHHLGIAGQSGGSLPGGTKEAVFMIGGSASGKGGVIAAHYQGYAHLDPDQIKHAIPLFTEKEENGRYGPN